MTALRVLIADDELLARQRLQRLLADCDDVEVVGEAEDGVQVLAQLAGGDVDLVLLDIRMPRLSGLEAASLLAPDGPLIVFTTAHAEHALEAFDHAAADYLLKPVDAERLQRALDRARQRLAGRIAPLSDTTDLPERIPIATRQGVVLLAPAQISHVLLDGATCVVYTVDASYHCDLRLAELHRRLPAPQFERLHRRALVNTSCIQRLQPTDSGGYVAHLSGGHRVEVSRQAARRLRRQWDLPR